MPTTSSSFSPITGMREKPLRSASESACRRVLSRSMNTMSVRGTITSRTIVSPSSNTEWIICALAGSISRALLGEVDQVAQLGLGGERALAEALARRERVAEQDQQPRRAVRAPAEARHRPALAERDPLGVLAARVRGATPMTT